jgi:cytochrome c-type protein NapB
MSGRPALNALAILSLGALLVATGAGTRPAPAAAPAGATPDTALGLVTGSVFDVPTPPAVKPNASSPGERPALPRPYALAPPRVPHAIADFLPITRAQNACIGCHAVAGERVKGEPTPLPPSHYTDFRNAPGTVGTEVAGTRHVCTSCHVAVTDAPDLIRNDFRP